MKRIQTAWDTASVQRRIATDRRRNYLALAGIGLLAAGNPVSAEITITDINPDQSNFTSPLGASGGRVNGLATTPGDPDVYYAASEYGGLYKTTDFQSSGGQWFRLEDHLPMLTIDVEVSPDGSTVYATSLFDGRVVSLSGINVSYDSGETWHKPPSSAPPDNFCADSSVYDTPWGMGIAVDPSAPAAAYIGTNCGLAISQDHGASWTFANPFAPAAAGRIWDVTVHHDGIIDVCGQVGHARSTDGGTSWDIGPLPLGSRCSIAASPHEADVILAVVGTTLYESDDGGATWTNMGTPGGRRQGRIPFVETNDRGDDQFDLWFGDVGLYRGACTSNPVAGGLRCPPGNQIASSPPPPGWAGSFTGGAGAHSDVGTVVFDTAAAVDACPTLFASDGGVYYNTDDNQDSCHDPQWDQPAVTPHATFLWTMDAFNPAGADNLDLYFGLQDNGAFGTTDGGTASPSWNNSDGADVFDIVAGQSTVLATWCCGRRLYRRGAGLIGGGQVPAQSRPPSGLWQQFRNPDAFDRYGPDSYVAVTADCTVGNGGCVGADGGLFVTDDVTVDPIAWTELGDATEPTANLCAVKSARQAGIGPPVFYAMAGSCHPGSQNQLWRFAGTDPNGVWQRIDTNLPDGAIGIFDVDPRNPNRLYASNTRSGDPRMVYSDDGGQTWTVDPGLDLMMTGEGLFTWQTMGNHSTSITTATVQPSLVAFDPEDSNLMVAGGVNSGVFVSMDGGSSWLLVSDPHNPAESGTPHIPRPNYAFFDHDPTGRVDIYIGTRGKGVMRIEFIPPANNYQYAAKIVCGDQPADEELRLIRGRYATTINIHNAAASDTVFQKRLSLSYPPAEQRPGALIPFAWDRLGDDESLETDCSELRDRLFDGAFPQDYIEGFITLRSTAPLDVTGVYTTADVDPSGRLLHSSIDVEHIPERRVSTDLRIEKRGEASCFPSFGIADLGDCLEVNFGAFTLGYHLALYTVTVTNSGPITATDVVMSDELQLSLENAVGGWVFIWPEDPITLPPGAVVTDSTQIDPVTSTITVDLPDLAPGDTATVQFWAIAFTVTNQESEAVLVDTARVDSGVHEADSSNNEAVIENTLLP
ncbi:MAG: hypothetical protein AAGI72_06435 [Pseudomonadota bacterium]